MQPPITDWRYRRLRRTTLIAIASGSFLSGLGMVQAGAQLSGWLWGMLACIIAWGLKGKKAYVAVPSAVVLGVIIGVWRGSDVAASIKQYVPFVGQKVTIAGKLLDDTSYGDRGQRDMRLTDVWLEGRSMVGTVRVTTMSFAQPRRGDAVTVTGKMYDGFGGYQAAIYFAELQITRSEQNPLEDIRRNFAAGVYSYVPDTQASLGLGMLIGLKSQIPDTLSDQLKVLALTHIVVASGYNLTILIRVARRFFEKYSKYQTAAAGFVLMGSFVLITGFSASMTRASFVTCLSLMAWYYGRRIHPVTLLLFAAALTASLNPLYLWSDIGWWLSFLAFGGVMLLAPLLERRLFRKKHPKLVGQLIIETIAAQLTTLPLLLMLFGSLSILGLVANVLIVPLVPLAMLLTFIAGVASLCFTPIAAYAALPAVWLLTFMTHVTTLLAGVPWAAISFKIDVVTMVVLYLLLISIGIVLWHRTKHDFLGRSVVE